MVEVGRLGARASSLCDPPRWLLSQIAALASSAAARLRHGLPAPAPSRRRSQPARSGRLLRLTDETSQGLTARIWQELWRLPDVAAQAETSLDTAPRRLGCAPCPQETPRHRVAGQLQRRPARRGNRERP